jgi:hypothetical protein
MLHAVAASALAAHFAQGNRILREAKLSSMLLWLNGGKSLRASDQLHEVLQIACYKMFAI